jgi:hypothetical protein
MDKPRVVWSGDSLRHGNAERYRMVESGYMDSRRFALEICERRDAMGVDVWELVQVPNALERVFCAVRDALGELSVCDEVHSG